MKIKEKVSFNVASEASYVYILSKQNSIENAKNDRFWRVFEKTEACGQTALPDKKAGFVIWQKSVENAKIQKYKWHILSNFQTIFLSHKVLKWDLFY